MLTLALKESLQVASNPAFATPDQENIFGGHDSLFCRVLGLVFVDCGQTSVGVGEDSRKVAGRCRRGGIYNARGLRASTITNVKTHVVSNINPTRIARRI
jgi:hypothetical protein